MSDASQGPGWWQASDGKWYPPDQAQGQAAAPSEPAPTQPVAGGPPVYGGPPAYAAPAAAAGGGGGSNTGKIIAIVAVLALIAGGAAFALTRGGGGGGGSVASFCDKAKALSKDTSLTNAFENPANVDRALSAFDQLTKSAPSEIKNDMNTLNDVIKKLGNAVKSAGNDQTKQATAIITAFATVDQAKVEQASKNLDKFGKDKCGADFSFESGSTDSSLGSSFSFDSSSLESELSSLSSFSDSFGSFDSDSFLSSLSSAFGTDFSDFSS